MIDTTKFLVKETASVWGFCQSDEITLCFYSEDRNSQIFFDGKTQKIVSVTASLATAFFNSQIGERIPEKTGKLATFDSRAFNVPTLSAAVRQYVWRENDATKNSLSMLCQSHFSHKELHGKRQADQHNLLYSKGINWNDLPSKFKRGTVVRRSKRESSYTAEEIEALPRNHEAHKNPALTTVRSVVESVELPPLTKVSNKVDVLFYGAQPILKLEGEKV